MSAASYPSAIIWSTSLPESLSVGLSAALNKLNQHKTLKKTNHSIELTQIQDTELASKADSLDNEVLLLTPAQAQRTFASMESSVTNNASKSEIAFKLPVGCVVVLDAIDDQPSGDAHDTHTELSRDTDDLQIDENADEADNIADQHGHSPILGDQVLAWIHANAADVILVDQLALAADANADQTGAVRTLRDALMNALVRAKRQSKVIKLGEYLLRENQKLESRVEALIQDQQAGQQLQRKLLPTSPKCLNSLTFQRYLSPALTLSGDFVDYFAIDENTVGFYLADVVGHGVSAAMITVLLKTYMSRYLTLSKLGKNEGIRDPAKVMMKLNASVLGSHMEKHLTLIYGVIDIQNNQLSYVNAGHFPYPALWDGQQWKSLEQTDKPVGLFDDIEFTAQSLTLPDTYRLFLSSDGYLESLVGETNADKINYLLDIISSTASSEESPEILAAVIEQSGLTKVERVDDISMLLIEKR